MKISFTVQDEVSSHRVEHGAVAVDPHSYVAWTQVLLECSMFNEIYVWLPNVCMVVNTIEVYMSLAIIMDKPGIKPSLMHKKLHLIMQAGLIW